MTIETSIDNAIRDHETSADAMRWTPESTEVAYLRRRLAAAEQLATIFGWCGADGQSERGKAATQAWMDWANTYGSPSPTPEWDTRITELARRRDGIRDEALRRLRGQ